MRIWDLILNQQWRQAIMQLNQHFFFPSPRVGWFKQIHFNSQTQVPTSWDKPGLQDRAGVQMRVPGSSEVTETCEAWPEGFLGPFRKGEEKLKWYHKKKIQELKNNLPSSLRRILLVECPKEPGGHFPVVAGNSAGATLPLVPRVIYCSWVKYFILFWCFSILICMWQLKRKCQQEPRGIS